MVGAPVSLSRMLPSARNRSGAPRKSAVNRKNGSSPSHCRGRVRAGRAAGAPRSMVTVAGSLTIGLGSALLDVRADDRIPLGRDELLRFRCLVRIRIDGAGDVGELGDQVCRLVARL